MTHELNSKIIPTFVDTRYSDLYPPTGEPNINSISWKCGASKIYFVNVTNGEETLLLENKNEGLILIDGSSAKKIEVSLQIYMCVVCVWWCVPYCFECFLFVYGDIMLVYLT